jgi:putative phosphoribosyl transferase
MPVIPRPADTPTPQPLFHDRADAGRLLSRSLTHYAAEHNVIVVGVARGGVPVAREVAAALGVGFAVLTARRVGVPGMQEVALGAIAEGHRRFVPNAVLTYIGVPLDLVDRLTAGERAELERQASLFRSAQAFPDLRGCTVIVVDDGLATGATLRAAVRAVRSAHASRVVVAVPVASRWGAGELRAEVDELVVLLTPPGFELIEAWYRDYRPVTDDDVLGELGGPWRRVSATVRDISERLGRALGGPSARPHNDERTVVVPVADGMVAGELGMPPSPVCDAPARSHRVRGLAILAHPGAGGRSNYRERYLAGRLRLGGYATLRVDLATRSKHGVEQDAVPLGTNVASLASRLSDVCDWTIDATLAGGHHIVLIGSGVGGAVALVAASQRPGTIWSVITRGARADLAVDALPHVRAPVLLVVAGTDRTTLVSNAAARRKLPRDARLLAMPHAGPTFDQPGALGAFGEQVMTWLERLEARPRVRTNAERRGFR